MWLLEVLEQTGSPLRPLAEVPAQPLDLRILEVWNRKVNVMWSEPYSGNSPVTNYVVHYWRDKGESPLVSCKSRTLYGARYC